MSEPTRRELMIRRAIAWSAGWVAAGALYLLLIDTTVLAELLVGAGAAVLAATGLELAREQALVGESVRPRWLARLHRPLLNVPKDIAIVTLMALRAVVHRPDSMGTFRVVPFAETEDDQYQSGRQALAQAAGSLAPNTFVVGIDEEREVILAHQLRRTEGRQAIDPMGLGEG